MVRVVMFCVHTNINNTGRSGALQKPRNTKFEVHLILHSKDITEIWDVQIRMYERMYDMYASSVSRTQNTSRVGRMKLKALMMRRW